MIEAVNKSGGRDWEVPARAAAIWGKGLLGPHSHLSPAWVCRDFSLGAQEGAFIRPIQLFNCVIQEAVAAVGPVWVTAVEGLREVGEIRSKRRER